MFNNNKARKYLPTRKVHSNSKTVVGEFSSEKREQVQFESGLEEGFLYILNFDSDVTSFHDQPFQIDYKDKNGVARTYTPDFLVEFKNRNPALFEVKSMEFIKNNHKEFGPIMEAGRKFAHKRNWKYNIITDKEINTDYGENVRFLNRYRSYKLELAITNEVLARLSEIGTSTPNNMIRQLKSNQDHWPEYISAIWTLVANKQIACNLFEIIHMETAIWIPNHKNKLELKYPYLCP